MPETTPPKLTRAEAARLNGSKSRGPRTQAGKARSARNALKHGLAAHSFALLPGEEPHAFADLLTGLAARYQPADALADHLVRRLASVMWRQARADRLEAEVLAQLEQRPDSSYLGGYVPSSPLAWDAARFSAVQRHQARLDRALFKLLAELERHEPAEEDRQGREELERPTPPATPANDDDANVRNEPKAAVAAPVDPPEAAGSRPERAAVERLLAEGRVAPMNDLLQAVLVRSDGLPGGT